MRSAIVLAGVAGTLGVESAQPSLWGGEQGQRSLKIADGSRPDPPHDTETPSGDDAETAQLRKVYRDFMDDPVEAEPIEAPPLGLKRNADGRLVYVEFACSLMEAGTFAPSLQLLNEVVRENPSIEEFRFWGTDELTDSQLQYIAQHL
jgi:hypothetical protein